MRHLAHPGLVLLVLTACEADPAGTGDAPDPSETELATDAPPDTDAVDTDRDTDAADTDADTDASHPTDTDADTDPGVADPFADRVVTFTPGEASGFGSDAMPGVVLGPPHGTPGASGSLDVVSLGRGGVIVLALDDLVLVDGPGPDLLVFENPFSGFFDPGEVAVSDDGSTWHAWPCDGEDAEGGFPGCAGTASVYAGPGNGIDPTDPATAGGDAFDLADLGLERARYVRVTDADSSHAWYFAPSGGFDLDAIAVVNGAPP